MCNPSTNTAFQVGRDGLTPWIDSSWIKSEPLHELYVILLVAFVVVASVAFVECRRRIALLAVRQRASGRRRARWVSSLAGGVLAAAGLFQTGCSSDDNLPHPSGAASDAGTYGSGWGSSSGMAPGSSGATSSGVGTSSGGAGSSGGSTSSSSSSGGSTSSSGGSTSSGSSSGGVASPTCLDPKNFNLAVFQKEIEPILFGTIDYNSPGQAGTGGGCAKARCHGGTSGSALQLKTSNTALQNLQSLACFINAKAPSQSQALLCPLNYPGCKHYPHPGSGYFTGLNDPNYSRFASWLYASVGVVNPFDYAYFVRQINPIFDDPTLGGTANASRTCSDTQSCHGVNNASGAPPNGSDFPMLPQATTPDAYQYNYWSAANLINFYVAQGSQLFLFPTNTIATAASAQNPFTTGLAHPGGVNFAANSTQANEILAWATGLQPDPVAGTMLNWLVTGPYSAQTITSPTPVGNETTISPRIFDDNHVGGLWDTLISQQATVDLLQQFPPPAQAESRVVYAVAYITNATGNDLQANFTIVTPNAAELIVGPTTVTVQANNGQNSQASATTALPSWFVAQKSTRVLLKVLQAAADKQFNFQLSITDSQNNQPFSNNQLIVRLDANGGL
jgi:hypothetical protein